MKDIEKALVGMFGEGRVVIAEDQDHKVVEVRWMATGRSTVPDPAAHNLNLLIADAEKWRELMRSGLRPAGGVGKTEPVISQPPLKHCGSLEELLAQVESRLAENIANGVGPVARAVRRLPVRV